MAVVTHLAKPAGQRGRVGIGERDLSAIAQPLHLRRGGHFGFDGLLQLRAHIGVIRLRLLAQQLPDGACLQDSSGQGAASADYARRALPARLLRYGFFQVFMARLIREPA